MILEEKIAFEKEVSVILTRDAFGDIAYYPLIENHHHEGILSVSIPWWDAPVSLKTEAYHYAKLIVESLNYVGTLAVEFFVLNHHVLFNEMAPRPHNSGHFSIEGATVSQFSNMILAITGAHVKTPVMTQRSIMKNILGQHKDDFEALSDVHSIFIHDYFKHSKTHNRKVGHFTILCCDSEELQKHVTTLLGGSDAKKTVR
jgi:5-(carboxyamino)imidazole ribonucleotide synthase